MNESPRPAGLRAYLAALLAYDARGLATALLLMLLVGLTEGVGLLLLIPLLELLNPGGARDGESRLAALFQRLGLSPGLETILLVYLALVVARSLLVYRRDILLADLRLGFVDHLRIHLNAAIGRADWLFLSRRRGSDLLHVLTSDIGRVGNGTYHALQLLVGGVLVLVQVGVAFSLSPAITLLTLATGAVLLLLFLPQVRRARDLGQRLTRANAHVFGNVSEFLASIKLAKSYTAEPRHATDFADAVGELRREVLAFTRQNSLLRAGYQMGAALALSLVLYLSVTVFDISGPTLLVLVLIFARLLPQLSGMQQQIQQLLHMLPAFDAAMALQADCEAAAEAPPSILPPPLTRAIRLQHVGFHYDTARPDRSALQDIHLQIPARATTAIVGPSGAGKSTLADLLTGLLRPTAGEILIDDQPLGPELARAWRGQVAYVPQEVFLFHATVRENLRWAAPDADDAELWRVLSLTAADNVIAALPHGLDTMLGDRGIRLSGGERQRLALARALLRRPALLILDEATSALDSEHERRIQQAIDALHGELTIVVIAHRLSTLRNADQLVVLEAGRIVEVGDWQTLAERTGGRFQAMLRV